MEVLAWRWLQAYEIYLANKENVKLVRFEDFIANKIALITDVSKDLRIPKKMDISDRVDIQFQPRGNRNVSWQNFFKDNLQKIEKICREYMLDLNYSLTNEKESS